MKTLRKTLLLLCTLASSFGLSAQTVSGKLVDEQNQPLPYANVVLLSLPDSAFVNGTISGENGTFTLDATSQNQIVKISSIGYKTVCRPVSPANIGIVQLVSDAQQLGEVVVKADLPKTRVKGDAMVTTVAGSILENAGTGNDLLNKIPGVSANEGDIKVFGAGTPEIYINGRKVRDKSELDQLASDNIKSVEVVNNPGSRYDATVNAVIRIQTKKPQANKYTYETGNPLLKPTLTQNVTLGATYRWMQLTAGYNRIKNQVINVTSLYDEENPTIMLMSLANAPAYDKNGGFRLPDKGIMSRRHKVCWNCIARWEPLSGTTIFSYLGESCWMPISLTARKGICRTVVFWNRHGGLTFPCKRVFWMTI